MRGVTVASGDALGGAGGGGEGRFRGGARPPEVRGRPGPWRRLASCACCCSERRRGRRPRPRARSSGRASRRPTSCRGRRPADGKSASRLWRGSGGGEPAVGGRGSGALARGPGGGAEPPLRAPPHPRRIPAARRAGLTGAAAASRSPQERLAVGQPRGQARGPLLGRRWSSESLALCVCTGSLQLRADGGCSLDECQGRETCVWCGPAVPEGLAHRSPHCAVTCTGGKRGPSCVCQRSGGDEGVQAGDYITVSSVVGDVVEEPVQRRGREVFGWPRGSECVHGALRSRGR